MIRPESPVFVGEYRDIRKQSTRITSPSTVISWRGLEVAVGRSSPANAPRPARAHHIRRSFAVHRIGSLLHRWHPSAQRSARVYLAGNLERDVRRLRTDPIAGGHCGSAALDRDKRSLREDVPTSVGGWATVLPPGSVRIGVEKSHRKGEPSWRNHTTL